MMNSLLYNVIPFRGFANRKPLKPEYEFLERVVHSCRLLGPADQVVELHQQRLNLNAMGSIAPTATWVFRKAIAYDTIFAGEAIHRFEGEGGRLEPAFEASAESSRWRTLAADLQRFLWTNAEKGQ